MRNFARFAFPALVLVLSSVPAFAQSSPSRIADVSVPRFVKYNGVLQDSRGQALTSTVQVTLSLYSRQTGGTSLWSESQTVHPDAGGRFAVSLGSTQAGGLPVELFKSGEARWLGVQATGEPEQPRVLLLSVPYAMKAADAETVGGLPASAFVLASPLSATPASSVGTANSTNPGNSANVTPSVSGSGTTNYVPLWLDSAGTLGNSALFQSGSGSTAKVGIGTTTPSTTLDVRGNETVRGLLNLPAGHTATSSAGGNSQPLNFTASAFNSGSSAAVSQTFRWLAEPVGNNTSSPSGSLHLLFGSGSNTPAETGFALGSDGRVTFASGQAFPGTIAGVTAGTDLTGGGTSGNVTLNLDTSKTDLRYAQLGAANIFAANQSFNGGIAVNTATARRSPANNDIAVLGQAYIGVEGLSTSTGAGVEGIGGTYGVFGTVAATSGGTFGVLGDSYSPDGYGVYGEALGTSRGVGVQGTTFNNDGVGVAGETDGSVSGVAIQGTVRSPSGTGVLSQTFAGSGSAVAFLADTHLTTGATAFSANGPSGHVFSVSGSGQVTSNTDSTAHNAASFTKGTINSPSTLAALQVLNQTLTGEAAWFGTNVTSNPSSVLKLVLYAGSTSNFMECDIPDGTRKCHISTAGTFTSGSDFAEALPAQGLKNSYEPGDVMVMSQDGKGVSRTSSRYSRSVVGIYSTRPAVLGAEKGDGETRVDADDIPVAITGIVPTKVSAENGAVRVGDLLVTSSKPGYAMKATDRNKMLGAVVGKALETLNAGTGTIKVLVILK